MTATVSPGSDPGYLINQVGKGGEHYYLKSIEQAGEPAGIWLGEGANDLGLTGEVDHELMSDMYSKFTHPELHAQVRASLSAITAEPGTDEYKAEVAAIYDAARVGRKPYDYTKSTEEKVAKALEELGPDATPEQRREAELKVRQNAPTSRSYYDVTFSVPKSYSLLHAGFQIEAQRLRAAGDEEGAAAAQAKADTVWECVMEGVQAGLEFLQEPQGGHLTLVLVAVVPGEDEHGRPVAVRDLRDVDEGARPAGGVRDLRKRQVADLLPGAREVDGAADGRVDHARPSSTRVTAISVASSSRSASASVCAYEKCERLRLRGSSKMPSRISSRR